MTPKQIELFKKLEYENEQLRMVVDGLRIENAMLGIVRQPTSKAPIRFGSNQISSIEQVVADTLSWAERRMSRHTTLSALSTSIKQLDYITDGLQSSHLIILAGRSSMGKSALALTVGLNAALNKMPVAIFSLELSKEQLSLRLLSNMAQISPGAIYRGCIKDDEFAKLKLSAAKLSQLPLFIDDTSAISIVDLLSRARQLHQKYNLGLIIIDYLQLMRSRHTSLDSQEHNINYISRVLKELAHELNVPIIAIYQLDDVSRSWKKRLKDQRPRLIELRESGIIEPADVIIFLHREFFYNKDADEEIAEIIIAKQPHGPNGIIKLRFIHEYSLFTDICY